MDSGFHRTGDIGNEMTFEKTMCEIKKEHKKMKEPAGELPVGSFFPHYLARNLGNYNREKITFERVKISLFLL